MIDVTAIHRRDPLGSEGFLVLFCFLKEEKGAYTGVHSFLTINKCQVLLKQFNNLTVFALISRKTPL